MKKWIFFLSSVLFLNFVSPRALAVSECREQVWGFNIYEVLVKGQVQQRFSIFDVQDWSTASAFEGLLVKSGKVAVVLKTDLSGSSKTYRFDVEAWNIDKKYFKAKKLDTTEIFPRDKKGQFVLQILEKEKVLCESTFKVESGH